MHRYVKYTSCLLVSGDFCTDVIFSSNQTVDREDWFLLVALSILPLQFLHQIFTPKAFCFHNAVLFIIAFIQNMFSTNTLNYFTPPAQKPFVLRQKSPKRFYYYRYYYYCYYYHREFKTRSFEIVRKKKKKKAPLPPSHLTFQMTV